MASVSPKVYRIVSITQDAQQQELVPDSQDVHVLELAPESQDVQEQGLAPESQDVQEQELAPESQDVQEQELASDSKHPTLSEINDLMEGAREDLAGSKQEPIKPINLKRKAENMDGEMISPLKKAASQKEEQGALQTAEDGGSWKEKVRNSFSFHQKCQRDFVYSLVKNIPKDFLEMDENGYAYFNGIKSMSRLFDLFDYVTTSKKNYRSVRPFDILPFAVILKESGCTNKMLPNARFKELKKLLKNAEVGVPL